MTIAVQTDISQQKWIEGTDKDLELELMKQALIDHNNHQIPAAYELYKNEITISLGLIFVDGKIMVPTTRCPR